MKSKLYITTLLHAILINLAIYCFTSCTDCRNVDCQEPDGREHLEFVDRENGKNLVFGANATIKSEAIKIFSFENQQRVDAQFLDASIPLHHIDSTLQFRLDIEKFKLFFVEFGNSDLDTIDVTTRVSADRCCGGIHFYTSFRYNGVSVDLGNNGKRRIAK